MTAGYYGLAGDPFSRQFNKQANCFQSADYRQASARLGHLKDTRGIGVMTAAPGLGKSLTLRYFSEGLNQNLFKPVYISLSTVTVVEFYRQLCAELGIEGAYGKAAQVKAIKGQIEYMYKEKRQTLVLSLDEAQYLCHDILKDLKMLTNFNYDSMCCFALVLCGEPHLRDILKRPAHEALRQRIVVNYDFAGLQDSEVKDYVLHKIRCAAGAETIIDGSAITALHGLAQGNPRVIDNLMSDALVIGGQLRKQVIDAEVIMAAADNRAL